MAVLSGTDMLEAYYGFTLTPATFPLLASRDQVSCRTGHLPSQCLACGVSGSTVPPVTPLDFDNVVA
jgi:hypothetical protein